MNRNPVDLNEKVVLFYDSIIKITREYESLEERILYLMKIVSQCDELIIASRKTKDGKLTLDFLTGAVPKLDENFIWLLDEKKSGPEENKLSSVGESNKYYISVETVEILKKNIFDEMDGLNNLKTAFEIEIKKLGDSLNEPFGYGSETDTGNKILIKSGLSDVVRIIEIMKEADIISARTNAVQIAGIFFSEPELKNSFDKKYTAIKSKLYRNGHASNSEPLMNFTKILIETSFGKKDHKLDELIEFIEEVQRRNNKVRR